MNESTLYVVIALPAVALIGSLFARRDLLGRICFTLGMPILFGMLWFASSILVGALVAVVLREIDRAAENAINGVAVLICLTVFVVMVKSMSKDLPGKTVGYSIGRGAGRRNMSRNPGRLGKLPSRRTWKG